MKNYSKEPSSLRLKCSCISFRDKPFFISSFCRLPIKFFAFRRTTFFSTVYRIRRTCWYLGYTVQVSARDKNTRDCIINILFFFSKCRYELWKKTHHVFTRFHTQKNSNLRLVKHHFVGSLKNIIYTFFFTGQITILCSMPNAIKSLDTVIAEVRF